MRPHPASPRESATAAAEGRAEKRAYVRTVFEQIAPRYDLLNHLLSFNVDRRWRRRALARLDWSRAPNGTYLDLCAGTLDVGAALVEADGFRGSVIGADFDNVNVTINAAGPITLTGGTGSTSTFGPVAVATVRCSPSTSRRS